MLRSRGDRWTTGVTIGRHYSHISGLSTTDRRVIEAHAKPRDSTRQRRLPPLCPSPRHTRNNIEGRSMDNRSGQEGTTVTSQGSLLPTEEWSRRTPSLETRPGRDYYPLCAPLPSGQGIILRGGRWTTGVTREALQPYLRAICYQKKNVRGARQA